LILFGSLIMTNLSFWLLLLSGKKYMFLYTNLKRRRKAKLAISILPKISP
jgi:hypothetical protein